MKKTKRLSAMGLALVLALGLAACGGGSSTASTDAATDDASATAVEDDGTTTYKMILAHSYSTEALHHQVATHFCELVEEYSGGRIETEIYPAAQLCQIDEEYSAMLDGRIQADFAVSSTAENFVPAYAIFNMPMLFGDIPEHFEVMKDFVKSDVFQNTICQDFIDKGIHLYPGVTDPCGMFCTVNKQITSLADMQGLKIRTLGGSWPEKTAGTLGYSSITIAGSELPTALNQGTVDGARVSLLYIIDAAIPINYVYAWPMDYGSTCPIGVSSKFYDSLPPELQEAVDKAGAEMFDWCADLVAGKCDEYWKKLEDAGIKVTHITDEDYWKIWQTVQPVWEEYAKSFDYGQDVLDAAQKAYVDYVAENGSQHGENPNA